MVSLEQITALGRSRSEANADRKRNKLIESDNASFFEHRKVNIGNRAVTWTDVNEITVWVYKRICKRKDSVFLCNYKKCPATTQYTSAVQSDDELNENISLLQDSCLYCGEKRLVCKRSARPVKLECQEGNSKPRKVAHNVKRQGSRASKPHKQRRKTYQNAEDIKKDTIPRNSSPKYKTESSFNSDNSNESSGDEFELVQNPTRSKK